MTLRAVTNQVEFRHNHYVPEWYQARFLLPGQTQYNYLDLKPDEIIREGHRYRRKALMKWSPKLCFARNDLYTVDWGDSANVDIEKFFFGRLDQSGPSGIQYFTSFQHPSLDEKAFNALLRYMSVQRLRTPKGLGWLSSFGRRSRYSSLMRMQKIQDVFCATWTERLWQVASAEESATKFIISDHPVTVYNRGCPPLSDYCKGFNDPDIRLVATHTHTFRYR